MGFPTFVYNQLWVKPTLPDVSFADQTIIITGSNSGLGLETARHLANLSASKVILAVYNTVSGESARQDIESTSGCAPGTVEVWPLDLSKSASVLAFAEKALQLPRLDALILNAAKATMEFHLASEGYGSGYEHSITVNTISHFLLALLLTPKLRQTALDFPDRLTPPHITVLSSQSHAWPKFPQWKDPRGILTAMSDPKTALMNERYPATKLLNTLLTLELVSNLNAINDRSIIVNMLDTGFCDTRLSRENAGYEEWAFDFFKLLFARTAEVGARTTVAAVVAGRESHGAYMVNGVNAPEALGQWVQGPDGRATGRKLWEELGDIAEGVRPGILEAFKSEST
ncbi:uncharacterized protein BDV17DRAFT_289592 [Aspergillus undulatus]|uniref:uncharacterized protein n=1 Tax=Aspergillus undulatus TaxID=1810928 RepID=UPI003CCCF154